MAKSDYIYVEPTTVNISGSTPYGIYDADKSFVSESVNVCKFVARRLGHPVMQLEFNSSSIYACFEEATSDYSQYMNNYNMQNWLWDNYGNTDRVSGSGYSNTTDDRMGTGTTEPQKPNMGFATFLSEKYGEAVNVGGDATYILVLLHYLPINNYMIYKMKLLILYPLIRLKDWKYKEYLIMVLLL